MKPKNDTRGRSASSSLSITIASMVRELCTYIAPAVIPYRNLALEAYMTETVPAGRVTFYLWQNDRTVVIGRHQNAWAEANVTELEADGGYLVRRLSGGGAVYHDTQNLNFTFIANDADYSLDRQLEVILRAVSSFGVKAEHSGRNDITVESRKFSGNAFYRSRGRRYHHGTLLVDVDTEAMGRYLKPSDTKLASKGVASVRSRVVNLRELIPDLTIDSLKAALTAAFADVYGLDVRPLDERELDEKRLGELEALFSSWEWKYGRNVPFTTSAGARYSWGEAELQLAVRHGVIEDAILYSDSLESSLVDSIPARLTAAPCTEDGIRLALKPTRADDEASRVMLADLIGLALDALELGASGHD